jgi:hypothetical protein
MYFWTKEIESINDNIVTFKDETTIEIVEKNKELFTENAITASELQTKWATIVAKQIVDVLHDNNVRLTDINYIINLVNDIISWKNDEAIVKAFWKENLDNITSIFGGEKIPSLAVRNIRMKDIF